LTIQNARNPVKSQLLQNLSVKISAVVGRSWHLQLYHFFIRGPVHQHEFHAGCRIQQKLQRKSDRTAVAVEIMVQNQHLHPCLASQTMCPFDTTRFPTTTNKSGLYKSVLT